MNWIQVQSKADGPHTFAGIEVFLPEMLPASDPQQAADTRFPLLLLLHARNEDRTQWMRQVSLERLVGDKPVAVALVQGNQSFFEDSVYEYNWGTYTSQEIPEKLSGWFPISDKAEDRVLMGVDMGGYGAIAAIRRDPQNFARAIAIDPVLDLDALYDSGLQPRPEDLFGPREGLAASPYAFPDRFEKPIVICCGEEKREEAIQFALTHQNVTLYPLKSETREERMAEALQLYLNGKI